MSNPIYDIPPYKVAILTVPHKELLIDAIYTLSEAPVDYGISEPVINVLRWTVDENANTSSRGLLIPFFGLIHSFTPKIEEALIAAVDEMIYFNDLASSLAEIFYQQIHKWAKGQLVFEGQIDRRDIAVAASPEGAEVIAFAQSALQDALEYIMSEAFPVSVPSEFESELHFKINFTNRCSWGGINAQKKPFVSLALQRYLPPAGSYTFLEYSHLDRQEGIGTVNGSKEACIAALVAHEVCHAVQMTLMKPQHHHGLKSITTQELKVAHGKGFQSLYRYLRHNWVNPMYLTNKP
ncbi:hypothetical protein [Neptuniibacter sp. QD37_11]|uniref:hypothetical protein n=1 Tax=Neptuniibacter sp. QD37_11 TaxID=3398209 RepID=UPI0039F52DD0